MIATLHPDGGGSEPDESGQEHDALHRAFAEDMEEVEDRGHDGAGEGQQAEDLGNLGHAWVPGRVAGFESSQELVADVFPALVLGPRTAEKAM